MGKFNQNNNGNNKGGKKPNARPSATDRPRNVIMSFSLVLTGFTNNNTEYDPDTVIDKMLYFQDNGIYGMLSVPVQTTRANLDANDPKKGNITVGFIKEFHDDTQTVDVSIYGSSADAIQKIADDLVVVPRLIVKNKEAVTFLGFDLSYSK